MKQQQELSHTLRVPVRFVVCKRDKEDTGLYWHNTQLLCPKWSARLTRRVKGPRYWLCLDTLKPAGIKATHICVYKPTWTSSLRWRYSHDDICDYDIMLDAMDELLLRFFPALKLDETTETKPLCGYIWIERRK